MKKFLLSLVSASFLLLTAAPSFAAAEGGIAAVVNDSVITVTDIKNRTDLYLSSSATQPPPEQRKKIEQQVLDRLIDETLQVQEAKKMGITIGDNDISAGFAELSKQNGLPPEEFKKRLEKAKAPLNSLYDQIRADIAWGQVVRLKLRPRVSVGDNDIDMTLNKISKNKGKTQYQVAEIFLNVTDSAHENDVRNAIENLAKKVTGGEPFSSVAHDSSQATGAATGGDLGWVQEGQLDPALEKTIKDMQPGQISPPIRSARGYHILMLRNRRQMQDLAANEDSPPPPAAAAGPIISIKQILVPIGEKDPPAVISSKIRSVKNLQSKVKSCEAMDKKMKNFPSAGTATFNNIQQDTLPKEVRTLVEKLKIGDLSVPIRTPEGLTLIMVCSREEKAPPAPVAASKPEDKPLDKNDNIAREKIANKLGMDRLGRMASQYLSDLRATAFIDKRL